SGGVNPVNPRRPLRWDEPGGSLAHHHLAHGAAFQIFTSEIFMSPWPRARGFIPGKMKLVISEKDAAKRWPSGLKLTWDTAWAPPRMRVWRPVARSQIFTPEPSAKSTSPPPVAKRLPFGLNAMVTTWCE